MFDFRGFMTSSVFLSFYDSYIPVWLVYRFIFNLSDFILRTGHRDRPTHDVDYSPYSTVRQLSSDSPIESSDSIVCSYRSFKATSKACSGE